MTLQPSLSVLKPLAILLALAGCAAAVAPYVHNPDEFNRASADFGQSPADIESARICYNASFTTPQEVIALATRECARVGKVARFRGHRTLQCSVTAPAQAVYDCVTRSSRNAP